MQFDKKIRKINLIKCHKEAVDNVVTELDEIYNLFSDLSFAEDKELTNYNEDYLQNIAQDTFTEIEQLIDRIKFNYEKIISNRTD